MNEVPVPINDLVQALVDLIAALLPVILPILFGRLVVWGKARFEQIKRHQPEWVKAAIEEAAYFGADFAEKVGPSVSAYGEEKMHLALDAANDWLKQQGYNIDDKLLRSAIEGVLFNHPEKYKRSQG